MQLRLADTTFDLTTRALYFVAFRADGDVSAQVAAAADAGADAVIVDGSHAMLAGAVEIAVHEGRVPVAARSTAPAPASVRSAVLAAGAALWFESPGSTIEVLHDVVDAGASLAIDGDGDGVEIDGLAAWAAAAAAGERVALVAPAMRPIKAIARAEAAGVASIVAPGDGPRGFGLQVAAMMAGARIIETSHVHQTRRVGTTVSELLERRSVAT